VRQRESCEFGKEGICAADGGRCDGTHKEELGGFHKFYCYQYPVLDANHL